MERTEMLKLMNENHYVKIRHMYFGDEEYIFMKDDGNVYDENGYLFENWFDDHHNGIRMRNGDAWESGWSIIKNLDSCNILNNSISGIEYLKGVCSSCEYNKNCSHFNKQVTSNDLLNILYKKVSECFVKRFIYSKQHSGGLEGSSTEYIGELVIRKVDFDRIISEMKESNLKIIIEEKMEIGGRKMLTPEDLVIIDTNPEEINELIEKIDGSILKFHGSYKWETAVIEGDIPMLIRNIIANKYKEAGWKYVYHKT